VQEQYPDKAQIIFFTPQGVGPGWGYRAQVFPALEGDGSRLVIDLSCAFVNTSPLPDPGSFTFVKGSGKKLAAVIDPGHGGSDPGATAVVVEKAVSLEVSKRVANYLQAAGVQTTLTRQDDSALSAEKRSDLTQRVALAEGKGLYVSIHANAAPASKINSWCGPEVYYYGPENARVLYPVPSSVALSQPVTPTVADYDLTGDMLRPTSGDPGYTPPDENSFQPSSLPTPTPQMDSARRMELSRTLASRVMSYLLGSTAAFNRGVRSADYYVVRYNTVPAILVEMGYATHPLEGLNLRDDNYLTRISYGIARGILEYLENDYPGG